MPRVKGVRNLTRVHCEWAHLASEMYKTQLWSLVPSQEHRKDMLVELAHKPEMRLEQVSVPAAGHLGASQLDSAQMTD